MNIKNFEFKAKVNQLHHYEQKLLYLQPLFQGTDHQIDTYFHTSIGRLKLREGNIENALIHYERSDISDARQSDIILYRHQPEPSLKSILETQLGVKVIVDKVRKIYFIDNVKFHFDEVRNLGSFIEVEAIDQDGTHTLDQLENQCKFYLRYFEIAPEQMIDKSYSDLIMNNGNF